MAVVGGAAAHVNDLGDEETCCAHTKLGLVMVLRMVFGLVRIFVSGEKPDLKDRMFKWWQGRSCACR